MPILSAASPVEIEAKADDLDLSPAARAAALSLFHDLTSREELAALALPPGRDGRRDGTAWPAHGLLFGTQAEVEAVVDALRARPDAAELAGSGTPEDAAPGILFLSGAKDGHAAVLVACADVGVLAEVMQELGADDGPAAAPDGSRQPDET